MKTKKARTCYVLRDGGNYDLFSKKPDATAVTYLDRGFIDSFCTEEFERFSGLKLDDGEVVRVRFSVEVL